jgi:hypothetical protein
MVSAHPFPQRHEDDMPEGDTGEDTATVAELQQTVLGDAVREIKTMHTRLQAVLDDTSGSPAERRDELRDLISADEGTLESVPERLRPVLLKKHPEVVGLLDQITSLRGQAAVAMMQLPHDEE